MQLNPVVRSVLTPVARAVQAGNESALAPSTSLDFINGTYIVGGQLQSFNRITFSRTSNATLTDSNGRVAYAPHNLLTNSEDFEASAWVKQQVTVSSNAAVAPDGTTTADKLAEDNTAAVHRTYQSVAKSTAPITYIYTIYVKAAERTTASVFIQDGTVFARADIDLSTGALSGIVGSALATDAGNGWWRVSVAGLSGANATVLGMVASNSFNSFTGTTGSGIFIWGAQLNVANAPVNLLTFSEQFDNAAWGKTGINTTGTPAWVNVTTAPDGTLTADKLIANLNNTDHVVSQATISITSGSAYTLSAFFKGDASNQWVQLGGSSGAFGVNVWANFDVLNGVVGFVGSSTTATIEPASNGFFRCAVTGTATASTTGGLNIFLLNNTNTNARSPAFVGSNTDGVSAWGAQLNTGSTALPYVATTSSIFLPPSYNSTTPKNLLGFTQEFDNAAWTKGSLTVSANTTATTDPLGGNTADKLQETAATAEHYILETVTASAAQYTATVYLKAAERTWASVYLVTAGVAPTWFNLAADGSGGVGTVASGVTATSQYIGNGWYRCSITRTLTAASWVLVINPALGDGASVVYAGTLNSGIYIWGAQLSNSASVDPYVYNPQAAPTSTAYFGPRFDYNPVTLAANGLLVEEQRSNLLTYSEQLNVAPSAKTNVTVADNAAVSPSGATTASKISATAVSNIHVLQLTQATSALTYTFSVYVKAAEYSWCQIAIFDGTNNFTAFVNLATGALGTTSGSATFGVTSSGNGWWRVSITAALLASATSYCQIWVATANNTVSFLGDGTSGILAYGAQLEAGSFATSYIPTVASQVTRAADNASMLGDNFATWYNVNEGTALVDVVLPSTTPFDCYPLRISGASSLVFGYKDVGTTVRPITGTVAGSGVSAPAAYKASGAYSFTANEKNGAVNGTLATATTTGAFGLNTAAQIGGFNATAGKLNGTLRQIAYYPVRLPDATLVSITS